MTVEEQIAAYIADQPDPRREDMRSLHDRILRLSPDARLWFLDGRDDAGKVVTNPNIGYGEITMPLAKGKSREFYRLGISANTSGISLYVIGVADKTFLSETYGATLGKASITGYCIKFRRLADLDLDTLDRVIRFATDPER